MPRLWALLSVLLAVALGWGLGACSSAVRPEVLQGWVGRPAAALEKEWGPPSREVEDQGLRLLIYEQVERASGTAFQANQQDTSARRSSSSAYQAAISPSVSATVYVRSYLFWVNTGGTVVRADLRQP